MLPAEYRKEKVAPVKRLKAKWRGLWVYRVAAKELSSSNYRIMGIS